MNCAANNPDLYFNRSTVFKFFEDYQQAIDGFKRAAELDPSLPCALVLRLRAIAAVLAVAGDSVKKLSCALLQHLMRLMA